MRMSLRTLWILVVPIGLVGCGVVSAGFPDRPQGVLTFRTMEVMRVPPGLTANPVRIVSGTGALPAFTANLRPTTAGVLVSSSPGAPAAVGRTDPLMLATGDGSGRFWSVDGQGGSLELLRWRQGRIIATERLSFPPGGLSSSFTYPAGLVVTGGRPWCLLDGKGASVLVSAGKGGVKEVPVLPHRMRGPLRGLAVSGSFLVSLSAGGHHLFLYRAGSGVQAVAPVPTGYTATRLLQVPGGVPVVLRAKGSRLYAARLVDGRFASSWESLPVRPSQWQVPIQSGPSGRHFLLLVPSGSDHVRALRVGPGGTEGRTVGMAGVLLPPPAGTSLPVVGGVGWSRGTGFLWSLGRRVMRFGSRNPIGSGR